MVEPEVAHIDLPGLLDLAEDFVFSIVQRVLKDNRTELETLDADIPALEAIQKPFVRLTYTEVAEILTSDRAKTFMAGQLQQFRSQKQALESELAELEAAEAKG